MSAHYTARETHSVHTGSRSPFSVGFCQAYSRSSLAFSFLPAASLCILFRGNRARKRFPR